MFVRLLATLLMVISLASAGAAHETFRVIGTLTRHQDQTIDVKNKDGKTLSIRVDKQTLVTRDKSKDKLPLTELKVGQSLVVTAYGDNETDLLALDIRIVPPIGRK